MHPVIFALLDELGDAFEADAFHVGLDEVFYLGEDQCPRCAGKDKAELFAGEVKALHDHLKEKHRQMWMWGDRLLDGQTTGLGEWEASLNGTSRAVDLIPQDVVICDWHYEQAEQTMSYFALKGFHVVTCPWKKAGVAEAQVEDVFRIRGESRAAIRDRCLGILQTVWMGAGAFMNNLERFKQDADYQKRDETEAKCFVKTFEKITALSSPPAAPRPGAATTKTGAGN